MEALGFGIRGIMNDVLTLEWHKYLIKEINKEIQDKIEAAMEHGDTWRLWGPHKLEIWCHMASSSCNFESMGSLKVIG